METSLESVSFKNLKISTELDKQYISVLPVRIHGKMKHCILDKQPSV